MSNSVKAGLWSALFAFLGVLLPALLGFVGDVADWAGSVDGEFPSVSPLGKAVVAAMAAAVTFLLNFGFRWFQERGTLPGNGPAYGELPPAPPPG